MTSLAYVTLGIPNSDDREIVDALSWLATNFADTDVSAFPDIDKMGRLDVLVRQLRTMANAEGMSEVPSPGALFTALGMIAQAVHDG